MESELHYLEDFHVGQQWTSESVTVDAEEIKAFAARYDPQVFHLDEAAAEHTFFRGLAASGWHTAAITMRLIVGCGMKPAAGTIGAGVDDLRWPLPVRPGDSLHLEATVLEIRASRSRPERGIVRVQMHTLNQHDQVVQSCVANVVVPARAG
ncbi:MAG: MaoC family dehydratase [Rhodocyclaceae bacterium]|nr:MAG: MaoC family dehydratase [Rhodocyclaceae bacterium]